VKDHGVVGGGPVGPPVLIIEGNIAHKIGSIYPSSSHCIPQYMQSYFWEPSDPNEGRKYYFQFDNQTVSASSLIFIIIYQLSVNAIL